MILRSEMLTYAKSCDIQSKSLAALRRMRAGRLMSLITFLSCGTHAMDSRNVISTPPQLI
jgi:hypothetical protein